MSLHGMIENALAQQPDPIRVGTVTNDSPVEVNLAGQSGLPASYLDSYTPAVDDVVLIIQNRTDLVILGLIVSGG